MKDEAQCCRVDPSRSTIADPFPEAEASVPDGWICTNCAEHIAALNSGEIACPVCGQVHGVLIVPDATYVVASYVEVTLIHVEVRDFALKRT